MIDKSRSGLPLSPRKDENVEKARATLREVRRWTIEVIAVFSCLFVGDGRLVFTHVMHLLMKPYQFANFSQTMT